DGVSVYIDRTRYFIPREDIIPMDEFRALQEKAAQGCSKNESGGCDCGAHRPRSASADLKDALDMAHGQSIAPDVDEYKDEREASPDEGRRDRRRRGKSNSRSRKSPTQNDQS